MSPSSSVEQFPSVCLGYSAIMQSLSNLLVGGEPAMIITIEAIYTLRGHE